MAACGHASVPGGSGNARTVDSVARNPAWDATGNLTCDGDTTHTVFESSTKLNYTYGYGNRLREVRDDSAQLVAAYTYDALNRRVRKVTYDDEEAELSDTWFLWDGWQCIEELDRNDSDAVLRRYVYGATYIDDHAALLTPDGEGGWTVKYYLQDRMQHVVALADSSGDVVERYDYEPYGKLKITDESGRVDRTADGSLFGNPYAFTGRYWDADAGLYYYRNRWCSCDLGRFTTRDPAGYVDGASLYQYGGSSPGRHGDPLGLFFDMLDRSGISSPTGNAQGDHPGIQRKWRNITDVHSRKGMSDVYSPAGVFAGGEPIDTGDAVWTDKQGQQKSDEDPNKSTNGAGPSPLELYSRTPEASWEPGCVFESQRAAVNPYRAARRLLQESASIQADIEGGMKNRNQSELDATIDAVIIRLPYISLGIKLIEAITGTSLHGADWGEPIGWERRVGTGLEVGATYVTTVVAAWVMRVSSANPTWKMGGHKSAAKWQSQMQQRGWTNQQITEAMEGGQKFTAPNNVNPANPATRYVHPQTGRSVVVSTQSRNVRFSAK